MKPILVRSQSEWDKLAPVLEKQGYVWTGGGEKPTAWSPYINNHAKRKIVIFKDEDDENPNSFYWGDTYKEIKLAGQTVDEYLQANPLEINGFKPDYKALYETQTKAIEEAIAEMETLEHKLSRGRTGYEQDKAKGFEDAIEILKEKLGK